MNPQIKISRNIQMLFLSALVTIGGILIPDIDVIYGVKSLILYYIVNILYIILPFMGILYMASVRKRNIVVGFVVLISTYIFNLLESLYFGMGTDKGFNHPATSLAEYRVDQVCITLLIFSALLISCSFLYDMFKELQGRKE